MPSERERENDAEKGGNPFCASAISIHQSQSQFSQGWLVSLVAKRSAVPLQANYTINVLQLTCTASSRYVGESDNVLPSILAQLLSARDWNTRTQSMSQPLQQ